ncbi:prepilin peptidase [Candidatus Daviesbacteria bacterium]|nr:prepilin peptidase [Candidatus Daviesbacteria bacterium]
MNIWFILTGFVIGALLGSLVKALADRSLSKRSFWGRSYCTFCKKNLHWYDLFPIISFLILRGRCRYCHKKISIEYLLVEVVLGALVAVTFWQSFPSFQPVSSFQFLLKIFDLLFKTFFITVLSVLILTDIKKMFIPDRVVLPAIVIGFLLSLGLTIYKISYLYYYLNQTPIGRLLLPPKSDYFLRHAIYNASPLLSGVLMAVIIGGFFMSLIIITKGKGMGGGDVKLGAFMGLMLGFPQALIAIILSFLSGAIFSIILIILGRKHFGQSIPFGPFLVIGSLAVIFWGEQILNWYLHLSI